MSWEEEEETVDWFYEMAGPDHDDLLDQYNCDRCRKRFGMAAAPEGYHDKYCEVCRQFKKWCRCH